MTIAQPVVDRLTELAAMGRMAIYSDIDGTLSPIASSPGEARVFPGAADALSQIRQHGIRVVAVSGRSSDDSKALLGVDGIDYAGNHGFELMTASGRVVSEEVASAAVAIQSALSELRTMESAFPAGVLIEDKTYTASVHYRLSENPVATAHLLKTILDRLADVHGILITGGRMVYELRPRLDINKGVFAVNDIRLHGITTAAFLGDDLTDVDGFKAIHVLAETGELLAASAIGVKAPESPHLVMETADLTVEGVPGMVATLRAFAQSLDTWSPA